ncbi:hypothetical protein F5B21DRAFT_523882 [Xylaria acuta]|nr:hypothetical protein F5B21DRAFT_523882 [Xylaria acuta]
MSIPERKQHMFTTATVWSTGGSNGINDYVPPERDFLTSVSGPERWVSALENIQSHREAPLTADEIDESIQFRADALPAEINKLIFIPSASTGWDGFWNKDQRPPGGWSSGMGRDADKESYESHWLVNSWERMEKFLVKHPYHIWPINTGGHWEVIFMVFETAPDHPTEYRRPSCFAIVDPRLSGGKAEKRSEEYERADFCNQQLQRFFSILRVNQVGRLGQYERMIWVPKQQDDDNWSSGLRVIQFVWEMLERIQDMETSGIRNIDALIRPMRPYFNPDYVRLSAAGAIAANGLDTEGFRGRICIARVREIRPKGRPEGAVRQFADGLRCPLALPKVERIPQEFLDRARLRQMDVATWKYVTHREQLDRDGVPALLEDSADRYRTKLQKEKEAEKEKGKQRGAGPFWS